MEHEAAGPMLTDFVRGALPQAEAAAIRAHMAFCPECRAIEQTARSVAGAVGAHGAALLSSHPSPDDLSRFALRPEGLSLGALAEIGAHVRACPTCGHEAEVSRRAAESAWKRAPAWLFLRNAPTPLAKLSPVLALLVAGLLYPGYLALVEYPESRARSERLERDTATLRERQTALEREIAQRDDEAERLGREAGQGGPARALILQGPRRGSSSRPPAVTPVAGQATVPFLVSFNPSGARGRVEGRLEIRIVRVTADAIAWRLEADVAAVWDRANEAITLTVPTSALTPARYRLEIRRPPSAAATSFTAFFDVKP